HLHSRYVLQLLGEAWKLLRILPNINYVSTCHSKEITICGDLHGQLEDLLLVFYKNGLPSSEKPYVFNGDFVDRGKSSVEILLILFAFLLVYPNGVHLNRGNHEDHMVNLRYGFTKEVLGKYRVHGKKILKLLQKVFSWLPLATVIDGKVLVVHGGISDTTDLDVIARMERHKKSRTAGNGNRRPPHRTGEGEAKKKLPCGRTGAGDRRWEAFSQAPRAPGSAAGSGSGSRLHSVRRRSLAVSRGSEALEEELRRRREQAGLSQSLTELRRLASSSSSSSSSDDDDGDDGDRAPQPRTPEGDEWKQMVDMLWSDPMAQDGCEPNQVRGGGCYWGPDVTEEVLTIFSASNYYEVGSNRGAYICMGPDLVPHFVQYQSSQTCRKLTLRQRALGYQDVGVMVEAVVVAEAEGGVSAVDAGTDVSAVHQAVLDELDVLQVVLDHADQVAQTLLLLLQVLQGETLWDRSISFLLYWAILATVVAWFFCSSLMSPEMICEAKEKLILCKGSRYFTSSVRLTDISTPIWASWALTLACSTKLYSALAVMRFDVPFGERSTKYTITSVLVLNWSSGRALTPSTLTDSMGLLPSSLKIGLQLVPLGQDGISLVPQQRGRRQGRHLLVQLHLLGLALLLLGLLLLAKQAAWEKAGGGGETGTWMLKPPKPPRPEPNVVPNPVAPAVPAPSPLKVEPGTAAAVVLAPKPPKAPEQHRP
ncbi:hypothetical protein CRUP_007754, partial [Coryphaenoides rupestris]